MGLQPEPHRWEADVGLGDNPTVVVADRVLEHERRDGRVVQAQGQELLEPGVRDPTFERDRGELAQEDPGAGRPRSMETVRGSLDPLEARATAAGVGEGPSHEQRRDDSPEIGERARQARAADAVDRNNVAPLESADVVGDHVVLPLPSMAAGDAELEDVAVVEPVEPMEPRRGAVGGSGVPTVGEGCGHEATGPRLAAAGHYQDSGVRLIEPAEPDRGGDAAAIEVQCGSLATGERSVLRGCKLGNGAYCVVRHGSDHMDGVSQLVPSREL